MVFEIERKHGGDRECNKDRSIKREMNKGIDVDRNRGTEKNKHSDKASYGESK